MLNFLHLLVQYVVVDLQFVHLLEKSLLVELKFLEYLLAFLVRRNGDALIVLFLNLLLYVINLIIYHLHVLYLLKVELGYLDKLEQGRIALLLLVYVLLKGYHGCD